MVDFAALVALTPAVSAAAIRDTLVVLAARRRPAAPTIEPLVVLAHARAECWRQLRARSIHADTAPEVRLDAEPLAALTPAERSALYLMGRLRLSPADAGFVLDMGARAVRRLHRRAGVALVRARTALALAVDPTPCPVRDRIVAHGAGMLTRKDVTALTLHAAECRICIDLLRRADATALSNYAGLPGPGAEQVEAVLADVARVPDAERARLVARAGTLRADGRPPRRERLDADPSLWLRRGIVFAVSSVLLLLVGLLMLDVS